MNPYYILSILLIISIFFINLLNIKYSKIFIIILIVYVNIIFGFGFEIGGDWQQYKLWYYNPPELRWHNFLWHYFVSLFSKNNINYWDFKFFYILILQILVCIYFYIIIKLK